MDLIKKTMVVTLLIAVPAICRAQTEKLLVPMAIGDTPLAGAYGSRWTTQLVVTNSGQANASVDGIAVPCPIGPCDPAAVLPGHTLFPAAVNPSANGLFLRVTNGGQLKFGLRVQDLSRQSLTWGTEVPTVREGDALRTTAEFLDVPAGVHFRSLLRVYDFDPADGHEVEVRIFRTPSTITFPSSSSLTADELLIDTVLQLRASGLPASYPGYAALSIPDSLTAGSNDRLRVEVVPLTSGLRYWGFVSVTNNETQHVTALTSH